MSRPRRPLAETSLPVIAPLSRGLDVLGAFRPGDPPLRNQEIAQRTGLPPSSVSRFTGSLLALGFLIHDAARQTYALSPAVLRFGQAFLSGLPVRHRLRQGMQTLAEAYAASVSLGVRHRRQMIYVECWKGPSPVPFRFDIGSSIPVNRSAMGWAYLAGLDDAAYAAALADIRLPDETAWRERQAQIEQARTEVAERGFCISMGAYESGIHTAGVPVATRPGTGGFSLTCGAPAYQLSQQQLVEEIGPRLVWLARSVLDPDGPDYRPPDARIASVPSSSRTARPQPRRSGTTGRDRRGLSCLG